MLSSGQELGKKLLDSKHVLKIIFKPSRQNKDFFLFLPDPILPGWLKILQLRKKKKCPFEIEGYKRSQSDQDPSQTKITVKTRNDIKRGLQNGKCHKTGGSWRSCGFSRGNSGGHCPSRGIDKILNTNFPDHKIDNTNLSIWGINLYL